MSSRKTFKHTVVIENESKWACLVPQMFSDFRTTFTTQKKVSKQAAMLVCVQCLEAARALASKNPPWTRTISLFGLLLKKKTTILSHYTLYRLIYMYGKAH